MVKDHQVIGVIARDEANVVTDFRASAVVFSDPVWQVFKVFNESSFDPEMVAPHCNEVEKAYRGDSICINIAVSRAPTIRATGKPDDYGGAHCFAEDWMGANFNILPSR